MQFKIYTRAVIHNQAKDSILLIKKNKHQKIAPSEWLLPGGTLDFTETLEQTLIREVKEETNLDIKVKSFLTTNTMVLGDTHWLGLYFEAEAYNTQELKNLEPEKHEKLEFIQIKDIPKMSDQIILNQIIKFNIN